MASGIVRAQWSSTGIYTASDFAAWSLPTGITPAHGMLQWQSSGICQVNSAGYNFTAVRVGRPLTIVDQNAAHTETVTPTAVTISGITCTVAAAMNYTHSTYTVISGTAGLQEAIDYAARTANQGGAVIALTPSWSWMGGTTGMISASTGQNGTALLDERAAANCAYNWNGSSYVSSGCGQGNAASLTQTLLQSFAGPLSVPFGITGPVTGHASLDVPVTTTVNGHPLSSSVTLSASDLTTGTLPHAQLPLLLSGDIPANAANTTGTAAGLSGATPHALGIAPIGTTACLQIDVFGAISNTGTTCGGPGGGTTTNPLIFNNSNAGAASGTSFNGGLSTTISTNSIGAVPTTRTVNGHALSANFSLTSTDTGSVPTTRTVNGHALSTDVTVSASDLTTGTLPHPQLPLLLSADIPDNAANTSGTAAGLTGAPDIDVGAITAAGPFTLSNTSTLLALGTASVSQNFVSNTQVFSASYWNGSVAVTASLQQFLWIGSGTNPAVLEEHDFPAGLNTNTVLYRINPATVATSGANIACPKFKLRGAYWTGSASALEDFDFTCVMGTGANPTDWFTLTHTGSSGASGFSASQFKATGGTPGIQLTAAAFATYPTCAAGTEGLEEAVTDSATATWGATVTGGSTNHIKMYCDGSAWTVEAK